MHIGMLWYDATPGVTLTTRIEKAVDYYRRKYHQEPNVCLINPDMLQDEKTAPALPGMEIRAYAPVLPGHLWVGVEDAA